MQVLMPPGTFTAMNFPAVITKPWRVRDRREESLRGPREGRQYQLYRYCDAIGELPLYHTDRGITFDIFLAARSRLSHAILARDRFALRAKRARNTLLTMR